MGLESRIQEDWLIWAKWESLRGAGEVGELKEESQQIVYHQTCLSPQSVLGKAGGQTAQGDPIHPGRGQQGIRGFLAAVIRGMDTLALCCLCAE